MKQACAPNTFQLMIKLLDAEKGQEKKIKWIQVEEVDFNSTFQMTWYIRDLKNFNKKLAESFNNFSSIVGYEIHLQNWKLSIHYQ